MARKPNPIPQPDPERSTYRRTAAPIDAVYYPYTPRPNVITWQATPELRWKLSRGGPRNLGKPLERQLQQKWVTTDGRGGEEWRDVPDVYPGQ